MRILKRSIAFAVCIVLTLYTAASAEEFSSADTARYLVSEVPSPQFGNEWIVTGLSRGDAELPEGYTEDYVSHVEEYVKSCGGILSENKYTEYSRAVIALTSAGTDPRSIAGYDLTAPLYNLDKVSRQGVNGIAYALLALDCGEYEGERDEYISAILSRRLECGGFSLSGDAPDADVTAMALQSLAKYTDRADVAAAVDEALGCLSEIQDSDGGFHGWSSKNSESCAQVIIALCELNIDINDSRFVKNGRTVLDALMEYKTMNGGFSHIIGGETSMMSSEQAYCALSAYERAKSGKTSFYDMSGITCKSRKGVTDSIKFGILFAVYSILVR